MEAGLKTIALIPEELSDEIMSTGLISIHSKINYEALVSEVSEIILNYQYKQISISKYPFLYRETHLEKLFQAIQLQIDFQTD